MESPETRIAVFNATTQSGDYMTGFMQNIRENKGTMNTMMEVQGMNMLKDNTMTMSVMNSVVKDGKMMNQMMQSVGMISEDCMQSSMKMMSDKGMSLGDMHN
jgi:hypothetical protein